MSIAIRYVGYGIGNYFHGNAEGEGTILINRHLLKYPKLHKKVWDHEMAHANGGCPDWNNKWNSDMWAFIALHPSTWVQFLPVWFKWDHGLKVSYCKNMFLQWCLIALWITAIMMVVRWAL